MVWWLIKLVVLNEYSLCPLVGNFPLTGVCVCVCVRARACVCVFPQGLQGEEGPPGPQGPLGAGVTGPPVRDLRVCVCVSLKNKNIHPLCVCFQGKDGLPGPKGFPGNNGVPVSEISWVSSFCVVCRCVCVCRCMCVSETQVVSCHSLNIKGQF